MTGPLVLLLVLSAAAMAVFALDELERWSARRTIDRYDQAVEVGNCRFEHWACCAHCECPVPKGFDRHHFPCLWVGCPASDAPMAS